MTATVKWKQPVAGNLSGGAGYIGGADLGKPGVIWYVKGSGDFNYVRARTALSRLCIRAAWSVAENR